MGSRGDSPRSEKMKATGSNPVESIFLFENKRSKFISDEWKFPSTLQ